LVESRRGQGARPGSAAVTLAPSAGPHSTGETRSAQQSHRDGGSGPGAAREPAADSVREEPVRSHRTQPAQPSCATPSRWHRWNYGDLVGELFARRSAYARGRKREGSGSRPARAQEVARLRSFGLSSFEPPLPESHLRAMPGLRHRLSSSRPLSAHRRAMPTMVRPGRHSRERPRGRFVPQGAVLRAKAFCP
jgi:hypothetical protein